MHQSSLFPSRADGCPVCQLFLQFHFTHGGFWYPHSPQSLWPVTLCHICWSSHIPGPSPASLSLSVEPLPRGMDPSSSVFIYTASKFSCLILCFSPSNLKIIILIWGVRNWESAILIPALLLISWVILGVHSSFLGLRFLNQCSSQTPVLGLAPVNKRDFYDSIAKWFPGDRNICICNYNCWSGEISVLYFDVIAF